jgi:hypothetical protein
MPPGLPQQVHGLGSHPCQASVANHQLVLMLIVWLSLAERHHTENQEQHEAALVALCESEADILVVTDLSGQGIDV